MGGKKTKKKYNSRRGEILATRGSRIRDYV